MEGASEHNLRGTKPAVRVTEVGEYVHFRSCERRFKLGFNNRALAKSLPFAERLFNTLDPVLQEAGRRREDEWETSLRDAGLEQMSRSVGSSEEHDARWDAFQDRVASLSTGQSAYGREVTVAADLGGFHVEGRIDFLLVIWRDGRPRLRIVECKASRKDRTYQRVQVALYGMIARRLLDKLPLRVGAAILGPEDIECVVARIDESTNNSHSILALDPLDLSMEEADLERLLAPDGSLLRIVRANLDNLSYQLDPKCDSCVFNVHCLPESARQRRLELVGIEPSLSRVLRSADISTIDDLATLDLNGSQAALVREAPGFTERLEVLQRKASTRRSTLPRGDADPDSYEVQHLPHAGQGQLPEHELDGQRLVRIYLSVDYDYTENRIGALSAHVTTSEQLLHTGFTRIDGHWQPDPEVGERWEVGRDDRGRPIYQARQLHGREVIAFKASEWTGDQAQDTGAERELIQRFLLDLIDTIAEEVEADWASIHFYVWGRSEIAQLVEGCSRAGSGLLGHLRELLGCRESLEQLIYSCLQDEVDRRYGLGWTGRGLAVVASLRWYGRRYHWRRQVGSEEVDLDRLFAQDIFDFKTTLALEVDNKWGDPNGESVPRHQFEIRSRFHDSLTAPYWRAYWHTLPPPEDVSDPRLRGSIRRYNEAARPPRHLKEYLRARVHALRWVEESVRFKNPEITKPALNIRRLRDFSLGVESTAQAAIDFLRLDQHVTVTDWVSAHLDPPVNRVTQGRTIPVKNVMSDGRNRLTATISLEGYDIDREVLATRCTVGEGSFARLSPCSEDPQRGQTFRQLMWGGRTCVVDSIDWDAGQVELTVIPSRGETRYILYSGAVSEPGQRFDHATLDESVSDFVAGRVEDKLQDGRGAYVYRWFDPESPSLPEQDSLPEADRARCTSVLSGPVLPGERELAPDQHRAIVEGLDAKVQLLQGPPGTGKTMTTAAAVLLRILARREVGDIVLVAANTHTAIDNLLHRISDGLDPFYREVHRQGITAPRIKVAKVHSQRNGDPLGGVLNLQARPSINDVRRESRDAVLVLGGTVSALLKMAGELSGSTALSDRAHGFQVPMLVVDEASMMVFPHFLALATLVRADGEIMLAGDHRQLAPILAHDWEREDRPPAVLYQPFASAYQAVQGIADNPIVPRSAACRSALSRTFRLPPLICDLISRIYRLDDIQLEGLPRDGSEQAVDRGGSWESAWRGATGLYLVLHTERQSKRSNEVEAHIIEQLLNAAGEQPEGSVAIVTPHRAQRTLLRARISTDGRPINVIDTVERLQGDERPTIIVSATASDPTAIGTNVEFILNLNRSNVAFSRAQERLIVVCSESLIGYIAPELEHYESAMLWKSLRSVCSELVATEAIGEHTVRVFTPPVETSTDGTTTGGR